MKIHKGDKVQIMAGKDKGKIAEVMKVFTKKKTVLVEGVNLVKKHIKPGAASKEGGLVSFEKPVDVSNVMFYSEKHKRPVRIGYKFVDGKKVRIMKAVNEVVEKGSKTSKTAVTAAKSGKSDKAILKKKVEKK